MPLSPLLPCSAALAAGGEALLALTPNSGMILLKWLKLLHACKIIRGGGGRAGEAPVKLLPLELLLPEAAISVCLMAEPVPCWCAGGVGVEKPPVQHPVNTISNLFRPDERSASSCTTTHKAHSEIHCYKAWW